MILAKVNTDIFAKTVSDSTIRESLGNDKYGCHYFYIRDKVYVHYPPSRIIFFLDGVKTEVKEEWFCLVGKSSVSKEIAKRITYNVNKVKVADL